jgi:hypothetical protein
MDTQRRLDAFAAALDDDVALSVVLAPSESLTPREVNVLLDWVRDGGTLLYAHGGSRLLADSLQLYVNIVRTPEINALERARWPGAAAESSSDPLVRDAGDVGPFRYIFRDSSAPLRSGSARVLARVQRNPSIIVFSLGTGRVVAFSDAAPLSNEALRNTGAAVLFARLAREAQQRGDIIEFDEYHHGYRSGGGPWSALRSFLGTHPGYAVLQAGAALLLVLVFAAHRFGAPYPVAPPRRRSPIEHVDALAGAYRRAGARWTARRLLLEGMQRRLGRRPAVRIRESGPPAGIERTEAGRQLIEIWERGADADLVAVAHAVDNVVKEAKQWR